MPKLINIFRNNQLLILIIILGALIRFIGLNAMPPALNWDEISHGYNSYSILKTGKDEWGESFPSIFRSFGDYKLPVYIYTAVPFVAVFGLNEWSVRLPSTIAGTLLIIFTYFLVMELFRRAGDTRERVPDTRAGPTEGRMTEHWREGKRGAGPDQLAILSAFFVAIEPWSFFLSRAAVEANLALLLIVAGAWAFLKGITSSKFLAVSAVLLGLSIWTYNSARVFVPLLLLTLVIIYKGELLTIWDKNKKVIAYCLLPIALFFLPMFWQLLNPAGLARYGWVAILDEGAIIQINESRINSQLPDPFPALVYNKATYFAGNFIKNYSTHFLPNFLFFQGGSQYQFNISGKGLIYPSELIFILVGLFWLVKYRSRENTLIFVWLLLAPVASSLTREAPHTLRSIVMMPIPQILTAVGLVVGWEWLRSSKLEIKSAKFLFVGIYALALFYFIESYAINYASKYREEYSWAWQYGYKEAVQFIKDNYNNYDQIIMTKKYGEPHEFILFYWPWEAQKYRSDPNLIRFPKSNWYWVDRFDKFYFVNDWEVPKAEGGRWKVESGSEIPINRKTLLVTSPGNYPPAGEAGPPSWKLLKTINFLDNKPVFEILENKL